MPVTASTAPLGALTASDAFLAVLTALDAPGAGIILGLLDESGRGPILDEAAGFILGEDGT